MSDSSWKFERGSGPPKHRWKHDYAGFREQNGEIVGKCDRSLDQAKAEALLNEGFPFPESADEGEWPSRIYGVYRGAIYEARRTRPGISYHGYPWRGDGRFQRKLPPTIMRKLRRMAEEKGCLKEFEQWLKKYGPPS